MCREGGFNDPLDSGAPKKKAVLEVYILHSF